MEQGGIRCTLTDESGCHAYTKNIESGIQVRVLPPGLEDVKLLVLQLDQGSIGAAWGCILWKLSRLDGHGKV